MIRICALAVGLAWSSVAFAANTVVYVVRHAEKVVGDDAPKDPPLTDAGEARADELARVLADVELESVRSTDTLRTRSTGKPAADKRGLTVQIYDHEAPDALAKALIEAGGAHLVVGHSNTVNGIVEALGGPGGPDLDESIYDRLYVVVVSDGGQVTTQLLHFGQKPD